MERRSLAERHRDAIGGGSRRAQWPMVTSRAAPRPGAFAALLLARARPRLPRSALSAPAASRPALQASWSPAWEKAPPATPPALGWGPSPWARPPNAVPQRGWPADEPIDVLIMVGYALDKPWSKQGVVAARQPGGPGAAPASASWSSTGAPHPDISTVAALRDALLAGQVRRLLRQRQRRLYRDARCSRSLGIAEQMQGKAHMIPATPVGEIVARGEAEIGFQQMSELKPIRGIDLAGAAAAGPSAGHGVLCRGACPRPSSPRPPAP